MTANAFEDLKRYKLDVCTERRDQRLCSSSAVMQKPCQAFLGQANGEVRMLYRIHVR